MKNYAKFIRETKKPIVSDTKRKQVEDMKHQIPNSRYGKTRNKIEHRSTISWTKLNNSLDKLPTYSNDSSTINKYKAPRREGIFISNLHALAFCLCFLS